MASLLRAGNTAFALAFAGAALACSSPPPPAEASAAPTQPSSPAPSVANAPPSAPPAEPSAAPSAVATAAATAEAPAPERPDNQVKPISDGADLEARAKDLFEAVAKDEPSVGDPFWFPKPPFLPLKDIKDPGKYWEQLHRAYARDIHNLHKKQKSWDGATFKGFEVGSTPKWVKPGDEANKIGYHRSFHGQIHYEVGGKPASIDVHTIITWQGRWFVTHLSKFKK